MEWLWIPLAILPTIVVIAMLALHVRVLRFYVPVLARIFQEKPLFILPFGQPVPDAEEITLTTSDGETLHAVYLHTPKPRKGVLLFGLEFGSTRWSCLPYCEFLREAGYDIFTFETRGLKNNPAKNGYEPIQWVTDFEVTDFRTAIAYLKNRADHDPRGIGLFGLSKGGSAGLLVASDDAFIRCAAVDGIFAAETTVMPFMYQWVFIYTKMPWLAKLIPWVYYRHIARLAIRLVERTRGVRYPALEPCLARFSPRPLLMIHGGGDTYIKPDMARTLFELAREPKELWMVEKAKHNQAFHLEHAEYKRRVLAFFDKHLAGNPSPASLENLETKAVSV